jgi:hypothetical protein
MYLAELDNEINRRKQVNALYNRYVKAVGNTGDLRLYEDPAEVEFVPLTTSAQVDYRNDLVAKLSKVIGMKNYDKVLDIVHSKLSDIQVREVTTNWESYKAFLQQYLKRHISFDRFVSEFIDHINKNTAPEQILDRINNLQLINGTGAVLYDPSLRPIDPNVHPTTDPVDPSDEYLPYDKPIKDEPVEEPTYGEDTQVETEDDKYARWANNVTQWIEGVLGHEKIQKFFHPAKPKPIVMQNAMKKFITSHAVNLGNNDLTDNSIEQLQYLFVTPLSYLVKEDDIFPKPFEEMRPKLLFGYLNQVQYAFLAILKNPLFDSTFLRDTIMKQYAINTKSDMPIGKLQEIYQSPTKTVGGEVEIRSISDYKALLSPKSDATKIAIYESVLKSQNLFTPEQGASETALPDDDIPEEEHVTESTASASAGSGIIRNKRYYVDKKAFGKGILEVRYNKNKHLMQDMKPIKMSKDMKSKIESNLVGNGLPDTYKLNKEEQRIYNKLLK